MAWEELRRAAKSWEVVATVEKVWGKMRMNFENLRRCEASSQPKLVLHSDLTFLAGNFRHSAPAGFSRLISPVTDQIPDIFLASNPPCVVPWNKPQPMSIPSQGRWSAWPIDPDDSLVPLDEPQTLKTFWNEVHFQFWDIFLVGQLDPKRISFRTQAEF